LTDTAILRFLRGRKHDIEKAYKAIVRHIKWREENNVDFITPESIQNEINANKVIVSGTDKWGRPLIWLIVRNHHKDRRDFKEISRFTIYNIEQALKASNPGEERVNIIFDMTDFGLYCMDYEVVRMLVDLLAYNYPDILHQGLIVSAPMIFTGCWMIIRPWIDPITASKVTFMNRSKLTEFIDEEHFPEAFTKT
jgi:hypothetical protein